MVSRSNSILIKEELVLALESNTPANRQTWSLESVALLAKWATPAETKLRTDFYGALLDMPNTRVAGQPNFRRKLSPSVH